MSNKRKEIRNAFKELLKGKTRALFSVKNEDGRMVWEEEIPAITVWVGAEDLEVSGEAPWRYTRRINVTLKLYSREVHEPIDQMDDFITEVENIVDGEDLFTLSESVDRIEFINSDIELQPETTKEGMVATLNYTVQYYSYAGVNPDLLPPLEEIHAEWDDEEFTVDQIDLTQT